MAGSQATAGLRGGAVRDSRHHTNSELTRLGPASARRPGPQQGKEFSAHLALRTRRRGGGDEQRNGLEQRKQGGAVHGFHSDVFPVLQPRSLALRRGGVEGLGEEETDRGGIVLGGSSPGLTTTALGAATGWWRRGAQPKSRGSARRGSRPERLRLGRRRRPSATQADGAAVQPSSPPSLPVFFFTNGDTVAPARRRSPRTTAAPGFYPASCASFLPPLLLPPSDFGGGGGFRGNPQGGGAVQGDAGWGGFL
jgi:hypothetical protein